MKAAIIGGITLAAVLTAVLVFSMNPATEIQMPQAPAETAPAAQPQIHAYFGNLTSAEWNSTGWITKLIFQDGRTFSTTGVFGGRVSGFNRYYNVTYQEPNQLISITEYIQGLAFQGGN